ncbi:iron ABC transporter permease [Mergibacter septicus]|uniref:metal ABC transporter permease n=1 Tax=Mergibacter septicus TaxID=221402 RepID=UPI0011798496|nr:metal ABC transporter permease [Mergibacter septicus]AWX13447.1 iron ABC transporter permease [Mergibacter septicus]
MGIVTTFFNGLFEPFQYPFMQYALGTALMISAVCAVLSCYLVLKGWSLMGDAISHAVLPGVVIAYILSIPLSIGAFFAGLFCAVSVGFIKNNSRIKEDTVMGIVFSGMFAAGLVLFSKIETDQHLLHILFGDILGISFEQMLQFSIPAAFILLIVYLKSKDLLLYCFDANHAKVIGLNTTLLHYGLLSLLALAIVGAMQIVGILLVIAMLIAPGITAAVLTKRFDKMLQIALSVSLGSTISGIIISYHLDASPGATIVLVQACCFFSAVVISRIRLNCLTTVENTQKCKTN